MRDEESRKAVDKIETLGQVTLVYIRGEYALRSSQVSPNQDPPWLAHYFCMASQLLIEDIRSAME